MDSHLEARIYYLTLDEGGRYTPVQSGYRGQFHYNGKDWDACQEFTDKELCYPGESVNVRLLIASPVFHYGKFFIGQEFEIREGARKVARGTITKVIRKDFEYWNYKTFYSNIPDGCLPHDTHSITSITKQLKSSLTEIKEFNTPKFSKLLPDKNEMLVIHCTGNKEAVSLRTLIESACKSVMSKLSAENLCYKIEFVSTFTWEILFATCTDRYLTGKIVVTISTQ
jgi:hypothetical protein